MIKQLIRIGASIWLICSHVACAESARLAARPTEAVQAPDHLMLLVFDQLRPDYLDRYNLTNFKRLREQSINYTNAYVGHLPSITLISHPVLSTGRLPRELPWQDEIFLDRRGKLGRRGEKYITGKLTLEQFELLMRELPELDSLPAQLRQHLPGKVFAVGEKAYAAITFGTPAADSIITLNKAKGRCAIGGRAVPTYLIKNSRFDLECSQDYGTKNSFYQLDGARFVPGDDPQHLGGDLWTFDVARELMEREQWSGLLLTFGGIDRVGHLLGEMDEERPHPFATPYTLEQALRTADELLGRLLDLLQAKGLLDRTLIVVTADHGAQTNRYYLGNASEGTAGEFKNFTAKPPPFWIERLRSLGNADAVAYDTSIRVWASSPSNDLVPSLAEISGVERIYELRHSNAGYQYQAIYQRPAANSRLNDWDRARAEELVNSGAGEGAPNYVALLEPGVGFGLLGDHGGAQEQVQRIPLIIVDPRVKQGSSDPTPVRLVDVRQMIERKLGF